MQVIRQVGEEYVMDASMAMYGIQEAIISWEYLNLDLHSRAWYPTLVSTRPQLLVTLHTDNLAVVTGEDLNAIRWLIKTGQHKNKDTHLEDIDLRLTATRLSHNPAWATGINPLETKGVSISLREQYENSFRMDGNRQQAQKSPVLLDLLLHEAQQRHLFVTLNLNLHDIVSKSNQGRNTFVLNPQEARLYVNLYLKAFGEYRISPNSKINWGGYYWKRLWNLVPAFQYAWPYAVFGHDKLPSGRDIMNFIHALYARLIAQMRACDQIGWLRYTPANNDTRDEMLNALNGFIIFATGIFDSLAWLAVHRFGIQVKDRQNITVKTSGRVNHLIAELDVRAPGLAAYLRDAERQAKVALFYGPRDSIQHRLLLTGTHYQTGRHESDCNVVLLNNEDVDTIRRVDSHPSVNDPFSTWGLHTFADTGSSILEPYQFTRTALQFLFDFVDGALEQLDLSSWIGSQPQLKAAADITVTAARSEHCRGFEVPYP